MVDLTPEAVQPETEASQVPELEIDLSEDAMKIAEQPEKTEEPVAAWVEEDVEGDEMPEKEQQVLIDAEEKVAEDKEPSVVEEATQED